MDSACWITNSGDLKSPLLCQAGAPLPFVFLAVDGDLHILISSLCSSNRFSLALHPTAGPSFINPWLNICFGKVAPSLIYFSTVAQSCAHHGPGECEHSWPIKAQMTVMRPATTGCTSFVSLSRGFRDAAVANHAATLSRGLNSSECL